MAYNSAIPQATDVKSQSQSQILGNFAALAPFGNGFADFTVKTTTPAITAADTGLYTRNNSDTSQNEMYVQKRTNNADVQVPMTASSLSNAPVTSSFNGWSYLPSGLLMKWGAKQITANGTSATIDATTISGGPLFGTTTFQVLITPQYAGIATNFSAVTNFTQVANTRGQFTVYASNANAGTYVTFLVIGA